MCNWIVTLKKQDCLLEEKVLTTTERLPRLIAGMLAQYPYNDTDWNSQDSITLTPTKMVFFGDV